MSRPFPAAASLPSAGPRPCVVLSCIQGQRGRHESGALARSGRGAAILVAEYAEPPARLSRHRSDFVQVPLFSSSPGAAAKGAAQAGGAPWRAAAGASLGRSGSRVLAWLLAQARRTASSRPAPDPDLVRRLMDKTEFDRLGCRAPAAGADLAPISLAEVRDAVERLRFPAIVKPAAAGLVHQSPGLPGWQCRPGTARSTMSTS